MSSTADGTLLANPEPNLTQTHRQNLMIHDFSVTTLSLFEKNWQVLLNQVPHVTPNHDETPKGAYCCNISVLNKKMYV